MLIERKLEFFLAASDGYANVTEKPVDVSERYENTPGYGMAVGSILSKYFTGALKIRHLKKVQFFFDTRNPYRISDFFAGK